MRTVNWPEVAELTGRAPSIHNTQPWRLVAGQDHVELWADRGRALAHLDPTGRQLLTSCGIALEHLQLALAAQGFGTRVQTQPDSASPDLLAVVHVADTPPHLRDVDLARWIERRATVRGPFEDRSVPDAVIEMLHREVADVGAWLRPVTSADDLITLSVLLGHADEAERTDPGYVAELAHWRRSATAADGVPDAAVTGPALRHSTLTLRDFDGLKGAASVDDTPDGALPVDEHPLVVIIGSESDSVADCLDAGRGVARVLLRAASEGVVASPLNQVIDDEAFRHQLRTRLGIVGQPHMVLRMGYGAAVAHTGRRPVSDYLVID